MHKLIYGKGLIHLEELSLYAASAFGLEGLISAELKRIGMKNVIADNGGVFFTGNLEDAFICNLRTRFSDRIYVLLDRKTCFSFEDLFQMTKAISWEKWTTGTESLHVSAQCARSRLMSPRDCQSVAKKAIIESLKKSTGRNVFPENGSPLFIHIHIHSDMTMILLNTSGESLSRRGYRTWNGEAPLRETLAASLVELSPWRPGMPLYDPCCGTGTILLEAALRQAHIAPGSRRFFAMEDLPSFSADRANLLRFSVIQEADTSRITDIAGSDIDPSAIDLALRHEKQAGLSGKIKWNVLPLQQVQVEHEKGVFICNPPYGVRLNDKKYCWKLYEDLGCLQRRHPFWTLCAVSSDPDFEKAFGRRAIRKRRLYNGRLECQFFVFSPVGNP